MSWETLVVGTFKFKDGIPEEKKREVLESLESILECEVIYNNELDTYHFEDINWSSHVCGKSIEEVVKEYKDCLEYFYASIYYLSEPHEEVSLSDGEVTALLI